MDPTRPQVLFEDDLDHLVQLLREGGRQLYGPVLRDGAPVLDLVLRATDLARCLVDVQGPGQYRLEPAPDGAHFDLLPGPDSAKRILYPSRQRLFRTRAEGGSFQVERPPPPPPLAILGLRACELAAIAIQDRVLRDGAHADPHYASRRADLLLVAVQCRRAAPTCFCASMGAGPEVSGGYDLLLTELTEDKHRYLVQPGSPAGEAMLTRMPLHPATDRDREAPHLAAERARAQLHRRLPAEGLREGILAALESPRWNQVAARCLSCANCTMVCPTCFCTQVTDLTDLSGAAERVRTWDSCFTLQHSYVHGGSVHGSGAARYRQWLSHKLSTWWDQFGTSGCVGCGRCICWCPAGIDIVEEARHLVSPAGAQP